jgi:hypothetical protein
VVQAPSHDLLDGAVRHLVKSALSDLCHC